MIAWFAANWLTIVVLCVLGLMVFGIIRGMMKDRKAGRLSCGGCSGDCAHCAHAAEHGKA